MPYDHAMKRLLLVPAAVAAFVAAGFAVAPGPIAANATPVALPSAYVLDVTKLPTTLATPCFPTTKVATISKGTSATVQYLAGGSVPAHTHSTANEIQYVISGTGTQRFGARTVRFGPGTVFVIPPGMPHAAIKPDAGSSFQLLVIKVPQQGATDNHFIGPPPTVC